jgi:hypothetical protein
MATYLSGEQNQLKQGTEFAAELTYYSEPEKPKNIKISPIRAQVKGDRVFLELQPKDLPIGTYDLKLTSNDKVNVSGSKTFTVWRLQEDVNAITSGKWSDTRLSLEKLSMCDRTGIPEEEEKPLKAIAPEPANDEPIDETKAVKVETETVESKEEFCATDSSRFPASAKAIGFQLDFDPIVESADLKIAWRADGEVISTPKVTEVGDRTSGLTYTLTSDEGFAKGDYELLLSLEAKNAKPIVRQFTIE